MKITAIGLGSEAGDITLSGIEKIKKAQLVIIKTIQTKCVSFFVENAIKFESLDFLFDKAATFDELNSLICDYLIEKKVERIAYCVPGNAVCDSSVISLKNLFPELKIIPGLGSESILLQHHPCQSFQVFTAYEFLNINHFDISLPTIITEIDDEFLAADLSDKLMEYYSSQDRLSLYDGKAVKELDIYELSRQKKYNEKTCIMITPVALEQKESFGFGDLKAILRVLRGENGCPWDKVQTHESIRINAIEEAYELADAIDKKDFDNMEEELGDCLLQVFFHTEIAREVGEFDYKEVLSRLCKKLISRHTHVFAGERANDCSEALRVWDKNKTKEKEHASISKSMEEISNGMPALMKAEKIQKKAIKVNFDWRDIDGALAKVKEEIDELITEIKKGNDATIEEEFGDLLFALVRVAMFLNIQSEVALNKANEKFIHRFKLMENEIIKDKKDISKLNLMDFESYWQKIKESKE